MIISRVQAIADLMYAAQVLGQAGCLPATDGNFSVRIDDHVMITRSGVDKRQLNADSFIESAWNDDRPTGASSEWNMHRSLYSKHPEIHCILHSHAPFLTTFAAVHRIPDVSLLAEAQATLSEIVLIPYHLPGSKYLGDALMDRERAAAVYLLANHGAVAVGGDVYEALHRMERAEFLARIHWQSLLLGGGKPLTREQQMSLLS